MDKPVQETRGLHEDLAHKKEMARWRLMQQLTSVGLITEQINEIMVLVYDLLDCAVAENEWANS